MSRQPRFEEIDDDSDPGELDLPEYDGSTAFLSTNDLPQASTGGIPQSADDSFKPHMITQQHLEHFKSWSCIYPVYFDASRSLQEGRRVPLKLGIKNPMAKELAEATTSLGVQSVFEPNKTHPKDWSNPGRIRVAFKDESGRRISAYKTKQALYAAMAKYLQSHPVNTGSPMKVSIPGYNVDKPPQPPAVPKGWKINEIVPLHSPALSGGGVSDNLMRDLMREEGGIEPTAPKKKGKKK